jgi:hypothetical protein
VFAGYRIPRYQPQPQAITGAGSLGIKAPRLQAIGELGISGAGTTEIGGPDLIGDGVYQVAGELAVTLRIFTDGFGVIMPRRVLSMKAGHPTRSLSGIGAATGTTPLLTAVGAVMQPDLIDRAWDDLQRDADEDDLLELLGVCDV